MTNLLHTTADHAADYLANVASRPVKATATSADLRTALGGVLPASGADPALIINDLAQAGRTGTVADTTSGHSSEKVRTGHAGPNLLLKRQPPNPRVLHTRHGNPIDPLASCR